MAIWLVRAGTYGEHEERFFSENRIYLTWENLKNTDLSVAQGYAGIKLIVQQNYPDEPVRKLGNWSGQIWAFAQAMKVGDWVAVPKKQKGTIAIGELISGYKFDVNGEGLYRHFHEIKWLNTDIPRSNFDQDLLYSLGAFLTVCEIKRNDAEVRIRAMLKNGFSFTPSTPITLTQVGVHAAEDDDSQSVDIEQFTRDLISKHIIKKFKGHGLARLVDAVLRAQGFTTYLSPEGPDKGIDILAAKGALGFDRPRICVQVKSGDTPADRPEFTQLVGAMQNVQAEQGLFVSWSDFKQTVYKEVPTQFFKVRLWNAETLIEQILNHYDNLDPEIRAELPLKRIWTLSYQDD